MSVDVVRFLVLVVVGGVVGRPNRCCIVVGTVVCPATELNCCVIEIGIGIGEFIWILFVKLHCCVKGKNCVSNGRL